MASLLPHTTEMQTQQPLEPQVQCQWMHDAHHQTENPSADEEEERSATSPTQSDSSEEGASGRQPPTQAKLFAVGPWVEGAAGEL